MSGWPLGSTDWLSVISRDFVSFHPIKKFASVWALVCWLGHTLALGACLWLAATTAPLGDSADDCSGLTQWFIIMAAFEFILVAFGSVTFLCVCAWCLNQAVTATIVSIVICHMIWLGVGTTRGQDDSRYPSVCRSSQLTMMWFCSVQWCVQTHTAPPLVFFLGNYLNFLRLK
jgi:hypothetical protein